MNAIIQVTSSKSFVIPNDGLVHFEGKDYVFVVSKQNEYLMQEVMLKNQKMNLHKLNLSMAIKCRIKYLLQREPIPY